MKRLEIEYVDINSIKPYKNNAKTHPQEQIEQIKKSIEQFGMDDPIGVWKNEIVEGHGRLIACKELGYDEIPIIRLDHLTDEERKAYTLAHNKLTMNSDFDIDILNEELASFETIDMGDFGFDFQFEDKNEIEVVQDEVPDAPEEPKSKLGDVYQLGNHRLMCGDSTNPADVQKLVNGDTIDLIVTDPPYNVNYGSINETGYGKERHNPRPIENDDMSSQDFYHFLFDAFNNGYEVIKAGGGLYVWYASKSVVEFQTALEDVGFLIKQEIIWNKSSFTLGRQDYQWKHEPCLYGWKDGAGHYFIDDRTQTTVIEDKIDLDKLKKEELRKLVEELLADRTPVSVIDEAKPTINDLHPTMKPIKLLARLIVNSSQENENVMDLFGGSGSTLIACEQLNRNCYMMEYDPHYVDVIVERWENLTGQKAKLLNRKEEER